jgi:branched-chain amino acid transport system substrate-binding protein
LRAFELKAMMRPLKLPILIVLAVGLLVARQQVLADRIVPDPGISSHVIKLGGVLDQTGRGTLVSLKILHGYELAIREINAQGGINGRKISYTAGSDNYDPSQTLQQVKKIVEADNVFAVMGVFGSDDSNVAAPYLENHHVPFFDPIGGGAASEHKRWVWQTEPDYGREGQVIAKYAVTALHARRIAVLYQVGVGERQVAAIKKAVGTYHVSFVGDTSYQATDSNFSGQALRLSSLNPDLVVLNGTPTPTSLFLQYARQAGLQPKYGFFANYPMGDPLWIALTRSNSEGSHVSSYADLTGKNRVARAYRRAIARYGGERYSNYGLYGYFNAGLLFRALKLCGRKLSRARLQYVLDHNFRKYNTGLTGRLDWTATQRYGARQFKIYRIQHGQFKPVTGWVHP